MSKKNIHVTHRKDGKWAVIGAGDSRASSLHDTQAAALKAATPLAPPISATLTIRQSFSSIACVLRTAESESESTAAQLTETEGSGVVRLYYTYANRPQAGVRHRSEMHDGAAVLTLKPGDPLIFEGTYWTSRRTTGDMTFKLTSRGH